MQSFQCNPNKSVMESGLDAWLKRKSIAYRLRLLEAIRKAQAGHTGGSLSCVDILNVLYHCVLHVSAVTAEDPRRDRYIQSKGHSVEALYVVLADKGFFPASDLERLCAFGSPYVGHPTRKVRGIEHNTGALGHGLAFGAGLALAGKLDGLGYRVFGGRVELGIDDAGGSLRAGESDGDCGPQSAADYRSNGGGLCAGKSGGEILCVRLVGAGGGWARCDGASGGADGGAV